jgi:hypothetical protein
MPSLMELVERVNKGELIDAEQLEVYQESANSAEKFLAHHAHAMLDLRKAQQHMLQSLEAIDYSDQKVLNQFVSVSGFLGLTDLRCGPIVKFGSCAMQRREYGLGLEAIQNAVAYDLMHDGAYTADRENCQFIAMQYDRAAQCIGWQSPMSGEWSNKQTKMAYVVSSICDDDASARALMSVAKNCDTKRYKFSVYSTECNVRRDKQLFTQGTYVLPSAKRGLATLDALKKMKVDCWCAPTDCDMVTAARELANQLAKDRVDVVLFDCTQADAMAAMLAQWECCRVKINMCRRSPMYMSGLNSVCYVDQVRFDMDKDFWVRKNVDSKFILEGIDLDMDLGQPPQRSTYGIPETACVLATAGTADTLTSAGLEVERVRKVTEEGAGPTVVDLIRRGRCNLVINTPQGSGARTDGYLIREAALVARVPCITTLSGAAAAVHAIANARSEESLSLQELQERIEHETRAA